MIDCLLACMQCMPSDGGHQKLWSVMECDGEHQKLWIGMEDIRSPGLLWTPSEALDCYRHQKPACGFFFFFLCGTNNKSTCKQPCLLA